MHVKRLKRGPQLGDLVIMNGSTQKKYRVTGFGEWVKEGRFGSMKLEPFVMLQFQGQFYADGRIVKVGKNPYREVGMDWFYGGKKYAHCGGYSVVVQTPPGDRWLTEQWKNKQSLLKRLCAA
jgi:hypothetical protein